MDVRPPFITCTSTDPVTARERLAYWDAYNAAVLIGLRTSTLSESGFTARQANGALHTMRIAEIAGNDHVIERSSRLVSAYPKDSVFACHLLKGRAYFIQGGGCLEVGAHETIIYDTRRPFTFGFLADMHELLIDIPVTELTACWGLSPDKLPLKVVPRPGMDSALGAELRRAFISFMRAPSIEEAEVLPSHTHTLLRAMVQPYVSDSQGADRSVFHVLAAKRYIAQNLADSGLTPSSVAVDVGVSVRHLNRLFASEGTSLADYIWAQRTARARHDLVTGSLKQVSIGEIAFRWGFSSQAHFARTIVARYGMTPTELRRQSTATGGWDRSSAPARTG